MRRWALVTLILGAVLVGSPAAAGQSSCPPPDIGLIEGKATVENRVVTLAYELVAPCPGDDPATVTAKAPWGKERSAPAESLEPGARLATSISFDVPAGQHGVQTFVLNVPAASNRHETGTITEQATDDNTVTYDEVDLGPAPDAPDLAVAPADDPDVFTGTRLEVTVAVTNAGKATAAASKVTFDAPWDSLEEDVGQLVAGAPEAVTATFDPIPDDRRGTLVDIDVAVAQVEGETNTENNTTRVPDVALPAKAPDLAVSRLRVTQRGNPAVVVVRALVRNEGTATAPAARAVVVPGWGARKRTSLPAVEPGRATTMRVELPVPQRDQGKRRSFGVHIPAVEGEGDASDNRARTVRQLLPAVGPVADGPPVTAIAVVVALLALLGWLGWRALLRRGPPAVHDESTPTAPVARAVRTGFQDADGRRMPDDAPLQRGQPYSFWIDVDPPVTGNGAVAADVFLTPLTPALAPLPGVQRPFVELGADVKPGRRSALVPLAWGRADAAPVLRCSLVVAGAIVWSRRIPVAIAGEPPPARPEVDFALGPQLDPDRLGRLPEHRLSVLLNSGGGATHSFTFIGAGRTDAPATFDAAEIQGHLDELRGALREAAWGTTGEWEPGMPYCYATPDARRLHIDLVRLAVNGWRAYDVIARRLEASAEWEPDLATVMRRPGLVQVAVRNSARLQFPAALMYDQPLDATIEDLGEYGMCQAFAGALAEGRPLADEPCFQGECPSAGDLETVCPSGFWGYRHAIGAPLSARDAETDLPDRIEFDEQAGVVVAVSTDGLDLREAHEDRLRRLCVGLACHRADSRAEALRLLAQQRAGLVYFYCHGGVDNKVPYIRVGAANERAITPDLLRAKRIKWTTPRPLVFVNGCRTTAVEPALALDFVGAWLQTSQAAGVVGTDVTVFEPLATRFAEACLSRFLDGTRLGDAVRLARLELLAAGDPLALAYVAYAMPALQPSGLVRPRSGAASAVAPVAGP